MILSTDSTANLPKEYYEKFVKILKASGLSVKTGVFAAHMDVGLVNWGPVTIIL